MIYKFEPATNSGVLGIRGYLDEPESVFCLVAATGEKFLNKGIIDDSLIFVDSNLPCSENELNVYCVPGGYFRLSEKDEPDAFYAGRVVMTVTVY